MDRHKRRDLLNLFSTCGQGWNIQTGWGCSFKSLNLTSSGNLSTAVVLTLLVNLLKGTIPKTFNADQSRKPTQIATFSTDVVACNTCNHKLTISSLLKIMTFCPELSNCCQNLKFETLSKSMKWTDMKWMNELPTNNHSTWILVQQNKLCEIQFNNNVNAQIFQHPPWPFCWYGEN